MKHFTILEPVLGESYSETPLFSTTLLRKVCLPQLRRLPTAILSESHQDLVSLIRLHNQEWEKVDDQTRAFMKEPALEKGSIASPMEMALNEWVGRAPFNLGELMRAHPIEDAKFAYVGKSLKLVSSRTNALTIPELDLQGRATAVLSLSESLKAQGHRLVGIKPEGGQDWMMWRTQRAKNPTLGWVYVELNHPRTGPTFVTLTGHETDLLRIAQFDWEVVEAWLGGDVSDYLRQADDRMLSLPYEYGDAYGDFSSSWDRVTKEYYPRRQKGGNPKDQKEKEAFNHHQLVVMYERANACGAFFSHPAALELLRSKLLCWGSYSGIKQEKMIQAVSSFIEAFEKGGGMLHKASLRRSESD